MLPTFFYRKTTWLMMLIAFLAVILGWGTWQFSNGIKSHGIAIFKKSRHLPAPVRFDFPYEIRGGYAGVWGGDNFQVKDENDLLHYVLIQGIDSPKPGQEFYRESVKELLRLIRKAKIRILVIDHDSHKREIAFVYANPIEKTDGSNSDENEPIELDIGLEIIRAGLAWYDGSDIDQAESYQQAQATAEADKRGLWIQEAPIAPWDFVAED